MIKVREQHPNQSLNLENQRLEDERKNRKGWNVNESKTTGRNGVGDGHSGELFLGLKIKIKL